MKNIYIHYISLMINAMTLTNNRKTNNRKTNNIEALVQDIRLGKMVILLDDEERENEGDLVMAAECVRPEDINFMVTHARGLVCLTLTQERCQQLALPLMIEGNNRSRFGTHFTVSIRLPQASAPVFLRLIVHIP